MQHDIRLDWKDLFDVHYELSDNAKLLLLRNIETLGDIEEVCEVIYETESKDFRENLIERALNEGLRFSSDHIVELCDVVFPRTAISMIASLDSSFFSSSDSVYDLATDLGNEMLCSFLLDRAVDEGSVFTLDQLTELTANVNQATADKLALSYQGELEEDDIDELYNLSDDVIDELLDRARQ